MKTIHYYRVSTAQQGRSGLGLEAQRAAVEAFCSTRGCQMLAEYTEIETGKRNDRPELLKALKHAKLTGATLVIAKLDRLSRNAAFLMTLKDSGTEFIAADMPDANSLTIGIMALIAQQEREATSKRTIEALQAAKARGTKLGNPNGANALRRAGKGNAAAVAVVSQKAQEHAVRISEIILDHIANGITSLRVIAARLNEANIKTARGGRWHHSSVKNLIERINQ